MSSTSTLENQIAALIRKLKEAKEAKKLEEARREAEHKEAEAAAERARLEEQHRLQEEAEAWAERERRDVEERRVEQEKQEEARHRQSCQETSMSPVVTPEPVLLQSKGKGLEVAPESEGVQESRRCDSCVRWNVECVHIKVSDTYLEVLLY